MLIATLPHMGGILVKQVGVTPSTTSSARAPGSERPSSAPSPTMLAKFDAVAVSRRAASASVHNLFAVHLQEDPGDSRICLPQPCSAASVKRLPRPRARADANRHLVVRCAQLDEPCRSPVPARCSSWAGAIALFASKMKLLTIGSWVVDLGKLAAAFLALVELRGTCGWGQGSSWPLLERLRRADQGSVAGQSSRARCPNSLPRCSRFAGSSVIGSAEGAAEGAGESRAARNSLLQSRPGSQLPLQLVARP